MANLILATMALIMFVVVTMQLHIIESQLEELSKKIEVKGSVRDVQNTDS